MLQNKKAVILTLSLLFLVLMVGSHMDTVSIFQFSDGYALLIRLEQLYSGVTDVFHYIFMKHGNAPHISSFSLAWIDDVFFGGTMVFLKGCLFFAMVGTALMANWVMYRKNLSILENLIVFLTADIVIAGTYNFDLYLPFQNCLTLTRFCCVLLLWKTAEYLSEEKGKHWILWLVLSSVVSLMHGVGMMFALGIFYVHVVTRQSLKKCIGALMPLGVYTWIQLGFSHNYGEVSDVSCWLIPYFGELLLSILSFYGGFCHILFGWSEDVCLGIGIFLFTATFITLLYFLIVPYLRIKWLPQVPLKNRKAVFTLGLLAISFLCSIGSAAFVVARKDAPSYDSVARTMGCGRYLCYGIVPYVILLYFSTRVLKKKLLQRIVFFVYLILIPVFLHKNDKLRARISVARNAQLDREALALLSDINWDSDEFKMTHIDASRDPALAYWLPKTYHRLQISNRYIWHNQPAMGTKILDPSPQDMIQAIDVSLSGTSDPQYLFIRFQLPTNINKRYIPLVNEQCIVIGFAHQVPHCSFFLKKHKLNFQRMCTYEGYVKKPGGKFYYAIAGEKNSYSPAERVVPLTVNFADKTLPIETSGLSYAESWGRWSDGDTVKFQFDVPQDKPLKFTSQNPRIFTHSNNSMVSGTIYANGVKVATWEFQHKKPLPKTEFVVPVNVLKIKKPLDIEIKIDGALPPIDLGVNEDKRRLGIGFRTLTISSAPPISVRPISWLQRYDFSEKTLPFLVSGLSHAEKWGRWTDGDTVRFRFDLPQDKSMKLDFKGMQALLYPNNPSVTGTIFANGVKVATWEFQHKKPLPKTEFVVPVNVLKIKKTLDIEIKIDGAKAPTDLGVNKDKRRLGLGFRSLIISPAP